MALQMITRFETADFAAWQEVFRTERESLGHAGLSVLQIWHEQDAPNTAWVLCRVNDRAKAELWIEGDAVAGAERAGITHLTHTFLETA
jgi:hypothetical protein